MKKILLNNLENALAKSAISEFENILMRMITQRANTLSPNEALKFLFRLDTALYYLQGQKSVEYGGGVHTKHRHTRYHDFFIERIQAQDRVLDIGCGNGAVDHDIAEKTGANVVGIDLSEINIANARKNFSHPRIRYIAGDALKDLPDMQFEVVILSNVLEHISGRPQFLRQVQQAIQPKRILIRVPLFERDWRVPLKKELNVEWRLDPTHEIEYSNETFKMEMEEAGLIINHLEVRWGEIWADVHAKIENCRDQG